MTDIIGGIMNLQTNNSDNISVRFTHLHPSDHSIDYVRQELSGFKDMLPEKSVVQAAFTRQKDSVKATLKVFTPAGGLFTTASGQSIADVCRQLVNHLSRRADRWKKRRHGRTRSRFDQRVEVVA